MEERIIQQSIYPCIKELKQEQMIEPITIAVTQAVFIKGLKKDVSDKDIEAIAKYIRQYITLHRPLWRIGEIVHSIELGSLGELSEANDQNGLSPELIVKWINRFHERFRKEALHKQKQHELKLEEIITDQKRVEGEQKLNGAINELFDLYLKGFDIIEVIREKTPAPVSLAACYYRHLDKLKLSNVTIIEKFMMFDYAAKQIRSEKPKREERKELQIFNQTVETQIKELAQSMALREMFLRYKNEGLLILF